MASNDDISLAAKTDVPPPVEDEFATWLYDDAADVNITVENDSFGDGDNIVFAGRSSSPSLRVAPVVRSAGSRSRQRNFYSFFDSSGQEGTQRRASGEPKETSPGESTRRDGIKHESYRTSSYFLSESAIRPTRHRALA
jgi:hypothetical protein